MREKFVSFVSAAVILMTAAVGQAQNQIYYQFRVTGSVVNVRIQPSEAGRVIDQVKAGTRLAVIKDVGDWIMVELPPDAAGQRRTGYIRETLGVLEVAGASIREVERPVPDPAPVRDINPILEQKVPPQVQTPASQPSTSQPATPAPSPAQVQSAVAPAAPKPPGKFGVGATLGYGIVPLFTYDWSGRNSIIGSVLPLANVLAVSGGMIHRFPQPDKANPKKNSFFEPFVGGGIAIASVSGASAASVYGTGGTFFELKSHPHVRYLGIVSLVPASGVFGFGATVGAVYVP